MLSFLQNLLAILARCCLSAIFLLSAVGNKIPQFSQTVEKMTGAGVPFPQVSLVLAIGFLVLGSLSLVIGWQARWGALLLFVFLVLATYFFHDFWNFEEPEAKQQQMIQFMKNLALMGGMLFIIANGAGRASVDHCCGPKPTSGGQSERP